MANGALEFKEKCERHAYVGAEEDLGRERPPATLCDAAPRSAATMREAHRA